MGIVSNEGFTIKQFRYAGGDEKFLLWQLGAALNRDVQELAIFSTPSAHNSWNLIALDNGGRCMFLADIAAYFYSDGVVRICWEPVVDSSWRLRIRNDRPRNEFTVHVGETVAALFALGRELSMRRGFWDEFWERHPLIGYGLPAFFENDKPVAYTWSEMADEQYAMVKRRKT